MDNNKLLKLKIAGILIPALLFVFFNSLYSEIVDDIRKLKIGLDGYFIGERLKVDKLKKLNKSYTGTVKYKKNDLVITVIEKNNIIIGLYKKLDNVSLSKFKNTISFLMMEFGEPTIEAHGKNIYWFYSKNGKIDNEKFLEMKQKGKIEKPLLMIKFHSDSYLSQINSKKRVSFYYIIYSEPLIRYFLKN